MAFNGNTLAYIGGAQAGDFSYQKVIDTKNVEDGTTNEGAAKTASGRTDHSCAIIKTGKNAKPSIAICKRIFRYLSLNEG